MGGTNGRPDGTDYCGNPGKNFVMKFGIFDHVDHSGLPLAQLLDRRLDYVAAADEAGFYGYHVAEHHATPLNLVPVPGVFLGAVANATKRIRLGPMVYLLPLYSPLRLIEEICLLDQLSHGRLEVGVGRGVSPFELNHHNIDSETSRDVFLEALAAVTHGLTHDTLEHAGKYFSYSKVPMELAPVQRPHPPIWYPSSNPKSSEWSGSQGLNFLSLGRMELAGDCVAAYKRGYAAQGTPSGPALDFPGGTAIGVNRHCVIADSDEAARQIARPAYEHWFASLMKLWNDHKVQGPAIARATMGDVDKAIEQGSVIAGSPETVRAEIERQIDALGINYLTLQFYFGTITHEDAMRSLGLFVDEIMPAFDRVTPAA
jgi:alkanesulfonate monooxygenase SsuD/methylene tetrahydromethanopterin reductase-like flavin-dependent oxidoreductase (luciferase family)